MQTDTSDYFSHLTREVRTSLSSVLGFVETLYDSHQTTKEKFICLRKIRAIIENTAKGLEDLEHLASFKKGWLSVRSSQFSLEEELSDTLLSLQSIARKSELTLQFYVEGKVPSIILSDPLRLRQVLTHVAHLFIQRMERGSIRITLSLTHGDRKFLQFAVDSTGDNLPPELFNDVLHDKEKSNDIDPWTPLAHGHAAMDLSLIHALSTSLGGFASGTKSKLGRNQALTVCIDPGPLGSDTPQIDKLTFRSPDQSVGVKSITIPNFSDKSFLVVEDDRDIADILLHFLKRTGAKVQHASTGDEGYRLASSNPYDLIFLDLQLPKLSGIEVCSRLRQHEFRNPIIALTANTSISTKAKCHDAGFSLYLTKPFSMESLFDLMPRIIM